MILPITYCDRFVDDPDAAFAALWTELDWQRRGNTPRREYYSNDHPVPYVYGRGLGEREYLPQPWHPVMRSLQEALVARTEALLDVCFLNGYEDGQDHLGYHADDSSEMDNARPIAIISLGAEREIWFCPQDNKQDVSKLKLGHGSLCLMHAGMQQTHFHRIPKAGFICGPRVSLTYRGFVPAGT